MTRATIIRLTAADLARVLVDVPELTGAVGPAGEREPWVDAAIRRWGCCGITVTRCDDGPLTVLLAAPSLHAPAPHPGATACRRDPRSAIQIASWAGDDDLRAGRMAASAMAGVLMQARVARLEAVAARFPSPPSPQRPSPRWLTGCGFGRVEGDVYALDVSATARWQARAALRWVVALPARMPTPRPAPQGQTGRTEPVATAA